MIIKEKKGKIIVRRNKPIPAKILNQANNYFEQNKTFFSKQPNSITIDLCDTTQELKKAAKPYYSDWISAVAHKDKRIAMKSPQMLEQTSTWAKEQFYSILKHEINHVFWHNQINSWSPQWLVEGLACYVGNHFDLSKEEQIIIVKKYKVTNSILDFRWMNKNFKTGHYPRYPIWSGFTRFLIKTHSENKLKEFTKKIPLNVTKKEYETLFKKVFGKSDKDLFNNYLEWLKK